MQKRSRRINENSKQGRIWAKTDGYCHLCGTRLYVGEWHIDHIVKRPQFSWTLIRGESNVQGGGGNGSIEERAGEGVGGDGGSPEGDRSARRRRGR